MTRQIVLDTETTGLSPQKGDRIIEIGCLEMVNRQLTGDQLHLYLNPERTVSPDSTAIHGLTNDDLADKPTFADIAEQLLEYITGAELIIHNAPFDIGFLDYEFKRLNPSTKPLSSHCRVVDTLVLARSKHPGQQNSLDALCRRYHVDNSQRDLHGALLDSELLAQVYLLMTGGQTALFGEDSAATLSAKKPISSPQLDPKRQALPVIKANADELAAHQQYLNQLGDEARALWADTEQEV